MDFEPVTEYAKIIYITLIELNLGEKTKWSFIDWHIKVSKTKINEDYFEKKIDSPIRRCIKIVLFTPTINKQCFYTLF